MVMSDAIYTCSTASGKKVKVNAKVVNTIEEIKILAAKETGQVILDVIEEQPHGPRNEEDES